MNIIVLGVLIELPKLAAAVYHTGVHGNRFLEDIVDEGGDPDVSHGVDATF